MRGADEAVQVEDRFQGRLEVDRAAGQFDDIARPRSRRPPSPSGRASRGDAPRRLRDATRDVVVRPDGEKPPAKMAQAEPVAGSSRIAGPLGKKNRETTAPSHSPRPRTRRAMLWRPRSSGARRRPPGAGRDAPPPETRRAPRAAPCRVHPQRAFPDVAGRYPEDVRQLGARLRHFADARCVRGEGSSGPRTRPPE